MDGAHVLVGFDGSPAAGRALRWAAAEASLRGVPLRVCHAWNWPYPAGPEGDEALEIVRGMGVIALEDGLRIARETAPGLDVRPLLSQGTPPAALLAASRDAELIVVGARGAGGFDRLPLGSTAVHVPAHADRPVVVVPAHDPARAGKRIVVGVDGSPASQAALRFALCEAGLWHASVTLVCAWWDPAALPGPDRLPSSDPQGLEEQAKARFAAAVAPLLAAHPGVAVERRFVLERAGRALADEARDARLLVVGDRGIGSSPKTLLGAVTRFVLHEAPGPVAVVHDRDPHTKEPS
ncbi:MULTISPECIES: universal stress protein [Actinomadura]|uniref:universal stress protein n=1 Tax=Actinomadura sp. NPDC048021 TaxID=3155385 RepID=UPI0033F249B7